MASITATFTTLASSRGLVLAPREAVNVIVTRTGVGAFAIQLAERVTGLEYRPRVTHTADTAGTTFLNDTDLPRVFRLTCAAIVAGDSIAVTLADVLVPNFNTILAAIINPVVNDIGVPGFPNFGVGIAPTMPASMGATGVYGNYQYTDGSIMCWIPAFFYKYGTGANGFAVNIVDIKPRSAYATVSAANAAGYALHRAFYDGAEVDGFFIDKYLPSNNGGTASSLKNGNPLSSAAAHNPFAGLTGAPANAYHGAIAAMKTRGADFFPASQFQRAALALLSLAHGQNSTSTAWNAWYDSAGTTNFPKGNNNNALGDTNDAAILYLSDGFSNSGKTGSANLFARTTHNGQNSGVCDLNGCMWEISLGIVSEGTTFYVLKTTARMKDITAGTTLATDAWGATGIAALYDSLGATYGALTASGSAKLFGNAAQVFDAATSGNAWNAMGAGIPLVGGVGGTNPFGSDGLWDYRPNEMCPIAGGYWLDGANAGVWALFLNGARGHSADVVGCRAALYL